MKKKLLALAVAGAFAAPVAMADTGNVTIYGVMHGSFDSTTTGNQLGSSSVNDTKISSNQSRIGFKGTEDVGDGTSAIWQIENGINLDNSTAAGAANAGAWNNRNTFVGLSGTSWGQVTLGNQDTPYKNSTRGMDVFADTIADNRDLMGGTAGTNAVVAFDQRAQNSIVYTSPDLNGFKASVMYIAGAEAATTTAQIKGNAYSLSGTYASGPLTGTLAYETHDIGTVGTGNVGSAALPDGVTAATGQKERAFKLAGGYAVDQFAVNLVYEKTTDGFGVGGVGVYDHKTWYLAGKYNLSGSDAVKLAYTNLGSIGNNNPSTGAKKVSVGYDHGLSKRTTVYALYTRLSNETNSAYTLGLAAGSTSSQAAQGPDADPAAFSMGIKHTF